MPAKGGLCSASSLRRALRSGASLTGMVLAVSIALSSCTTGRQGDSRGRDSAEQVPNDLVILLAETKSLSRFLEHDEVRIALECMRKGGVTDLPELPMRATTVTTSDALALLTQDERQSSGGLVDPSPDYWGEITELTSDRSDEFRDLLFGADVEPWAEYELAGQVLEVSVEGCMAASRSQLYGSLRNYLLITYLPQIAEQDARAQADSLSAYRLRLATWVAKNRSVIEEANVVARTSCQREREFGCQSD